MICPFQNSQNSQQVLVPRPLPGASRQGASSHPLPGGGSRALPPPPGFGSTVPPSTLEIGQLSALPKNWFWVTPARRDPLEKYFRFRKRSSDVDNDNDDNDDNDEVDDDLAAFKQ